MAELKHTEEKVNEVISKEKEKRSLIKGLESGPLIKLLYKPSDLEGIYAFIDELEKGGFPIGHTSIYADGSVWQKISEESKGGWKEIRPKTSYLSEKDYISKAFEYLLQVYNSSSRSTRFHADFIDKIDSELEMFAVNHPGDFWSFVKNENLKLEDGTVMTNALRKFLKEGVKNALRNNLLLDGITELNEESYKAEETFLINNVFDTFSERGKPELIHLIREAINEINEYKSYYYKVDTLYLLKKSLKFKGEEAERNIEKYEDMLSRYKAQLSYSSDKDLQKEINEIKQKRKEGRIGKDNFEWRMELFNLEVSTRDLNLDTYNKNPLFSLKLPSDSDFEIIGNTGLKESILKGYRDFMVKTKSQTPRIEKLKKEYESALKINIDNSSFWINRTKDTAFKILTRGRFLTQFETGTSGGCFYPTLRDTVEKKWFGFDSNIERVEDRPVYGYISDHENGKVSYHGGRGRSDVAYGEITFKIRKSSVEDRSTFTVGDSLNKRDAINPSSIKRPLLSSLPISEWSGRFTQDQIIKRLDDQLEKGTKFNSDDTITFEYWELQIHKGLKASDIEEIHIDKYVWENNFDPSQQEEFQQLIAEHNKVFDNIKLVIYDD